jgi:hypothetical protein
MAQLKSIPDKIMTHEEVERIAKGQVEHIKQKEKQIKQQEKERDAAIRAHLGGEKAHPLKII